MWFSGGLTGSYGPIYLLLAARIPNAISKPHAPSMGLDHRIDTDLQSLLQDTTISQDKELSESLAWIDKLSAETSCTQLAAMRLITDCKLLDNPSEFAETYPEVPLDDVKLEYVVKLAVCEISGAQPDRPVHGLKDCARFLPSTQACAKPSWWGHPQQQPSSQIPCYPEASAKDLHACSRLITSSTRFWNSYSNARVHAASMCHASRHAVEREKTIQLHKNLSLVTFRLQSSLHGVEEQMAKMRESTDGILKFAEDARLESQKNQDRTKEEIRSVELEIGRMRNYILDDITAQNNKFNVHMDATLTQALTAVREGHVETLSAITGELHEFYLGLKSEGSELAVFMNDELQKYHSKALHALYIQHGAMIESYNIMSENLDNASDKVDGLKDRVDSLNDKTSQSLAKIDILDHRLDDIGTKFKSVERAFTFLDSMFHLGKTCFSIVLILLGLSSIFLAGKASQKLAWAVLALSILGFLLHILGGKASYEQHSVPEIPPKTFPPKPLSDYFNTPTAEFWIVLSVGCFIVAAFLPKINATCEYLANGVFPLATEAATRLGILHHQNDHGNMITLPTSEVSAFFHEIPKYHVKPFPAALVPQCPASSHGRFDSFIHSLENSERTYPAEY